ncbi:MAG: hypothetical protein E6Q83_03575 [Thiothrix sp.]|nr:MAG: hypothetical protein E6Q83_03575 [Thiothrix sp.]
MSQRLITQQAGQCGQWLGAIDRKESGLMLDLLVVDGAADDSSIDTWNGSVANGVVIFADNVTIKKLVLNRLHVGVEIRGNNCSIEQIEADLISGDVIQGDGQRPFITHLKASNLLKMLSDELYHPDVVQWRGNAVGGVIDVVVVVESNHPLARKNYQGLMFSDGVFEGWCIRNISLPGCHPEHAITFAEARDCHVENVTGGGAVRFRNLNGIDSSGCTAINVDGKVEGTMMVEVYNAAEKLGIKPEDVTVGILYNNPCAIKKYDDWQGEVAPKDMPSWMRQVANRRSDLLKFVQPEYGMRAAVHLLLMYQQKYSLNTVRKMINRWSPYRGDSADNTKEQTSAYVSHVANRMRIDPDETVAVRDYQVAKAMLTAMIEFENGWLMPYSDTQIDTALMMAGLRMPQEKQIQPKPKMQSKERQGSVAIGVGGAGAAATTVGATVGMTNQELVTKATDTVTSVAQSGADWLTILVVANTVCLLLIVVGAFWWWKGRELAGELLQR